MPAPLIAYVALGAAIVSEVVGSTFLQRSEQFTRPLPTLVMAAFYAASFFFLAQALRHLPLGLAYAIWGGLGIVLTAIIGVVVLRQTLDLAALVGIGFIVTGVAITHLFSHSASHA